MTVTKKKTSRFKYKDQKKLNRLTEIALQNIDDLYEFFGSEFYKGDKAYFSNCFIHGGDNINALNFYYNADYRMHFKCRTHYCEHTFGTSLLSMIRGGLSHLKYGWEKKGDKTVTFDQTVNFLLKRYDLSFMKLEGKSIDVSGSDTNRISSILDTEKVKGNITRDFYRSRVEIPSQYYLNRGYSIEVLDEYDIGVCKTYGKPMFNRSVVPVYDTEGETIVGFTGRSIFEECKDCGSYHDPNKKCHFFPKWRHVKGFPKEKCLYNYWRAKEHIQKTGVIILVESPGNVWRLEEAGIHNSVALFGTALNYPQRQLIDESGALTIIVAMDNDDNHAGQKAAIKIKEQCERTYRVYILDVNKEDIGSMNTNEVTSDIKPFIDSVMENYI